MAKLNWGPRTLGSLLRPEEQREALARFVHRYTGNHRPAWSRKEWKEGKPYPLQFKDDAEWLRHTVFRTNKDGTLNGRVETCESSPTWPDNPELRKNY